MKAVSIILQYIWIDSSIYAFYKVTLLNFNISA
jgi:hypothetical protein